MDDLRLPQKTLNDYFELLDYQRDFLALKAACEQMQAKLAKIKIATSDPDSVDNIIDDEASSLTTTYSSEKIVELFSLVTNDAVIAKEKIVTAINAKKPSCNAKVSDTWDVLSFYISLMGNLQFNFSDKVLNKVRVSNLSSTNMVALLITPLIYQPTPQPNGLQQPITSNAVEMTTNPDINVSSNMKTQLSIFLGGTKIY